MYNLCGKAYRTICEIFTKICYLKDRKYPTKAFVFIVHVGFLFMKYVWLVLMLNNVLKILENNIFSLWHLLQFLWRCCDHLMPRQCLELRMTI